MPNALHIPRRPSLVDDSASEPSTIHLVTNPADDNAFGRFVRSRLAARMVTSDLEAAVRKRYPRTVVHPRLLDAQPWTVVWYVYREGHWIRPDSDRPRTPSMMRTARIGT